MSDINWVAGTDAGQREGFKRSLNVTAAGTVLLQTTISKVVQMLVDRQLGIQNTLPVKAGSGDAFYSNRRTAATTGAAWVDDDEEPVESEGTYSQVSFTYRTLLGRIKVTRKLIRTGRSYGDVLASELIGKSDDFANQLESASAIGDNANNAKQISGLLTLIGAVSGQTVANTNVNVGDGVFLDKADEAISKVKGRANKAAMRMYGSDKSHRLLNNALQAQQRFLTEGFEIEGGFVVASYQGIPFIISTGIPDVLVFNATAPKITAFTGGATSCLIFVNTMYIFYSELTAMTVMPLAKGSSQYDEIDMYLDSVLVLDNTLGGSILGGLA